MSKLWKIKISAILGWYSWNCSSAVGCFGWADGAPAWGTLWACKILDWPRTCAYNRPKMWVNYERSRFQPFWADTAEIVQLLLGALVVLILHQPGEHCRYPRFMIVQELVPITGQNCDSIMRDWDFSHFGLIQLTFPNCCWVLWLCWCCTSLGNIVGTPVLWLFKNLCL